MKVITLSLLALGFGLTALVCANVCCDKKCVRVRKPKVDREADYTINPLFINRTSPYVFSGEAVTKQELYRLFDAARWAPSSYNEQPWRFIYGIKGTEAWDKLFDLMVDFNKQWAKDAGALVLIVSRNTFTHNNQPAATHSFDTGAAWQNMALQALEDGLATHGMGGFDYEKARTVFEIPEGYTVEALIAIGHPGSVEQAGEMFRERVAGKPTGRKNIEDFAFEGHFEQK